MRINAATRQSDRLYITVGNVTGNPVSKIFILTWYILYKAVYLACHISYPSILNRQIWTYITYISY